MYDKENAAGNEGQVLPKVFRAVQVANISADQTIDVSFLDFFNRLPKKSPETGTLRLFERVNAGDIFYAAYGPDALFVAQHVFHTKSVVKYLGAGARRLESVTLKVAVAKTLLREALSSKQLRVEIYESESGGGKKSTNFKLTKEV
jgi:DNA mismatch repair protein MSH2